MRKYTLTFFIKMENKNEILEDIDCDYWVEIAEDASAIIYCLNTKKDSCVGYPSSSLRKIEQNHGVLDSLGNFLCEKVPEGYT